MANARQRIHSISGSQQLDSRVGYEADAGELVIVWLPDATLMIPSPHLALVDLILVLALVLLFAL